MSHKVFRVESIITIPDPDMPQPRYHNTIFVETDPDSRSGIIYHVTGDITTGMVYMSEPSSQPEQSETFHRSEYLGTVKTEDYPDKLDKILAALPPPPKQKHFNVKTMRTEQIRPEGGFYGEGEAGPPMVKCTEWTVTQAIPALYAAGVLSK